MNQQEDGKKTINSAFFYSLANIISVIVSFIAIPILTNILSTNDMGIAVSFTTLKNILSYIVLLSMYTTIDRAILDYKGKSKEYICSIYIFSDIFLIILYLIYLIFNNTINQFLGFNTKLISFMFLIIFAQNGYTLMTTYWNFKNEYKKNFIVNLLSSPVSQILSIILSLLLVSNKYIGRIVGIELFTSLLGFLFGLKILIDGKFIISKKYIKYALLICLPIIPHLISQTILAQSDLLMIKHFVGNGEAGIYSLAYSIALVLYTILLQIMRPWSSWVYRRMDLKEYESIKKNSVGLLSLGLIFTLGLLMVNKEVIVLFLNNNYKETIYIVPTLAIGVFFQFIYMFYYDIQYYYKKSKNIMYGSLFVAILNIILNFILIPKYGYKIAGFTTLISYLILALYHFISTKKMNNSLIYNNKIILSFSFLSIIYMIIVMYTLNNLFIRYSIGIILLLIIIISNFNNYIKILKIILNKNDNDENYYISNDAKKILTFSKKFPNLCKFISISIEFLLLIIDSFWITFNKRTKKTEKKQIIVIFLYNLGDIVIFLDLASKLRKYFPEKEYDLNLICQSSFVKLIEHQNLFDNIYGIKPSVHVKNIKQRFKMYDKLNFSYEYVLSPLGFQSKLGTDVLLNRVLKSKNKFTIFEGSKQEYQKISKFYLKNYSKIIYINSNKYKMQIEINNLFFNKICNQNSNFDLPILKKYNFSYKKNYYVVFPSSSSTDRVWDINKYYELIKKIYNDTKLPVMLCGTSNDKVINNKLKELLKDIPYIDMTNKTNILEFIELIRNAKFVISNDTGTYHIAIATKTNVLVIAPEAHFSRFIKYGNKHDDIFYCDYVISDRKCIDCNYKCPFRKISDNTWPCLNDINEDMVWKKTKKLIQRSVKK